MRVLNGDCRDLFKQVEECSVDAIVTDPPYELGFMGKTWDASGIAYDEVVWREALRVLRPGGHLLAFGGSRTYHRMACAIEDAGFEVRDQIMWLYGSGFPKSLDVSKAIDKAAGATREATPGAVISWDQRSSSERARYDKPATNFAAQWQGWGTALKPAHEPIVVARKPFKGTVAGNVLEHGTGAINIDDCRVEMCKLDRKQWEAGRAAWVERDVRSAEGRKVADVYGNYGPTPVASAPAGRWPANVILDEEAGALLDEQSGTLKSGANPTRRGADTGRTAFGEFEGQAECVPARGADTGGASRFFYCAKASRRERNAGLDGFEEGMPRGLGVGDNAVGAGRGSLSKPRANQHPTVKPIDLMRYLVRLVTPKGGLVLDPFTGSGTTGIAAVLEGMDFLGFEQDQDYAAIADARIGFWQKDQQMNLDLGLAA